jgi:hypothetical protein
VSKPGYFKTPSFTMMPITDILAAGEFQWRVEKAMADNRQFADTIENITLHTADCPNAALIQVDI